MSRIKNAITGLAFGAAIAGASAWAFASLKGGRRSAASDGGEVLTEISGQHPNAEDAPLDGRLQNRLGLGRGAEGDKLTHPILHE